MLMVAFMLVFAGCSSSGGKNDEANGGGSGKAYQMDITPVTLTIFTTMADELFKQVIGNPMQKKYPFITLNHMHPDNTDIGAFMEKSISAGTIPDITFASPGDINKLQDLQVLTDLTPLAKKHNFDLGRLDPNVLSGMKKYSEKNELLGMPESLAGTVLLYNLAIFDKFGVPYPKDGMTWDQTKELAKKVSRDDGGRHYRGLDINLGYLPFNNQLSLGVVKPETGKADVNNEGWKKWFNNMKSIYEIPGNEVTAAQYNKAPVQFMNEQSLAMYASGTGVLSKISDAVQNGLVWDMVTFPAYPDLPNTGTQPNATFYFISSASKNKDISFDVIAWLLSDEVQTANSRTGRISVLKNQEIRNEYGKDLDYLRGKNAAALFKNKAAAPAVRTANDRLVLTPLKSKFKDVVLQKEDVNSALREAEEAANQAIQEARSQ
jgi:multiple sugar transport system substrate-binding protein